jgi:HK97 gp10 family phage protein
MGSSKAGLDLEIDIAVTFSPGAVRLMDGKGPAAVKAARNDAVKAAAPFVARQLSLNTPVGAGTARQAVSVQAPGALGGLVKPGEARVGYAAPASAYIGFANNGTRPHTPPWQPVYLWATRKGIAPGAVFAGIRKHGTRAQHFVEQTVAETRKPATDLMAKAAVASLRKFVKSKAGPSKTIRRSLRVQR